jgi:3-methyladenine DNA glycosylase AlkD
MTYREVMRELKSRGTAQNRKVYKRHGAGDKLYGVSFADLRKLQKKIKTDHALALKLWDSGNMDAQVLATMVADPDELKSSTANAWMKEIDYYVLSDQLAELVAKAPFARKKMEQWMKSPREYYRACGYTTLAVALKNGMDIPDLDCRRYLRTIQKELHPSPNRARYSMNNALIAIGVYKPGLTREAVKTAKKIGKVEVDHGETNCKTPDAVSYIEKALQRKK